MDPRVSLTESEVTDRNITLTEASRSQKLVVEDEVEPVGEESDSTDELLES